MLVIEYQLQWVNRYGYPQEWITCAGRFDSMEHFNRFIENETANGQRKNYRNVKVLAEERTQP